MKINKKNNRFKALSCILLVLAIVLIPSVSAFEFDNVKSYDPITRKATINNCALWIGTCLIEGDVLAELSLATPLNVFVSRGDDKLVGEFTFISTEDVVDALKDLYLTDLKNGKSISRGQQFKYKQFKEVSVDDYETICEDELSLNGTLIPICNKVEVGSHMETQFDWIPILNPNNEFVEGVVYEIGVFVDVEEGDHGDWRPKVLGVEIGEWAEWTEDLNTDLMAYYKLDNNDFSDSTPNGRDGINTGTTNTTGIIIDGRELSSSINYFNSTGYSSSTEDYSFQFWLSPDDNDGEQFLFDDDTDQVGDRLVIYSSWAGAGNQFGYFQTPHASTFNDFGVDLAIGFYQHVIVTLNGATGDAKLYINGTLVSTILSDYGGIDLGNDIAFGCTEDSQINCYDGEMDEVAVWDRVLNQTEVTQLYNTGAGLPFGIPLTPPNIILNSPITANYTTLQTPTINFTAWDDINLTDVKLYVNAVLNQTNASGINNTDYLFDLNLGDGDYTIYGKATDNDSQENSTSTIRIVIDTTPFIEFLTPPTLINYANITQEYIPMKVNVSTPYFKNITYLLVDVNTTEYTQFYTTTTYDINFTNIPDAHYHYNVTVCTTTNQCNSTETRHINHDATPPTLTSAYNLTDLVTFTLPINSTWHYNASDPHIDDCYYNSTEDATQTVVTCNATIYTTWTTGGNKTITFCANDTLGSESCNTEYAYIYYIQETQTDSPDPIAEGFDATFTFIVNLTSIPTTTATLILNNTVYAPTTTTAGTDGYYFEAVVSIPDGWGNTTGIIQDWLWNYTISGVITNQNTSTDNITVYELGIDNCSSYGEIIFDFDVLDEETLTPANETLTINVEADLVLTSKTDATQYLSYNNTWASDNNPQICVPSGVINNSQYWMDLTVGFSSTDHVWEFYYIDSGTLNSTKIYEYFNGQTTQEINLMDLLTADSTSFLFNYFDIDGLAVDGSIVHVMRKYIGSGVFREVERAKQDQNGDTIVHLVEEDVIYFFLITKDGVLLHTSSEYTALCQATPCTIQIEASGGSATFPTDWDLMDGGAYTITSSASTRDITLTYTNNVSTAMNLTVYKYNSDGSYNVIDTGSDTGTSGSVVLNVPQASGNVSFFATVIQDDDFINSEWIDFEGDAGDFFGTTLALFMGALIILSLGLFAVSEGVGTIVYVILGVIISGALGLIITDLSTGVNIVIYLVLAGGILLWKLTEGRK